MDTPDYPAVPFGGVTELRIHGVSGTPTDKMLQNAHPVQVWGDRSAGFYRPAHDHGPPDQQPPAAPRRTLEAYSWGGLTAGKNTRAAWLLLLPFMLLNVASWAHPVRRAERYAPVGWMTGALRVLGLTLTFALVLAAAVLGMDVLAWQCAGTVDCGSEHFYTKFLTEGRLADPGTRIAVGALLPLVLLHAMRWLSKSTGGAYEEYADAAAMASTPLPADAPMGARDLAHPNFWNGGAPLARTRALHVTAATAGIAGLVAHAARAGDPGDYTVVANVVVGVALATVVAIAVLLASPVTGRRRELFDDEPPHPAYCAAVRYGPLAATALFAVAAVYAAFLSDRPAAPGRLPGFTRVADSLLWTQIVVLLVLLIATWVAVNRSDGGTADALRRPMFWGYGAPVIALLGLMLGSAYASGLALRVADVVGNPTVTSCQDECPGSPIFLADEYFWSARGFAVAVVFGAAAFGWVWLLKRRLARNALPAVAAEYPGETDPKRSSAIAKAHAAAMLTDRAAGPALLVLGGTCVVTAALWMLQDHLGFLSPLTTAGTWAVGVFAVAVVGLARSAYKNPEKRRVVGILWDLGTFWPRSSHPFAPPCYCERTVPEFVTRIRQIRAGGGKVVVSAHSQGTVIAAASLMPLHQELDGVALLTYGSPLQRLYARTFPHFFGTPVLRWANDAMNGRWVNLYRRSDPIGAPVLTLDEQPDDAKPPRPDKRLTDPAFRRPRFAFRDPKTRGHSDYWDDQVFGDTVNGLATEV